jgi:hypothetical protein
LFFISESCGGALKRRKDDVEMKLIEGNVKRCRHNNADNCPPSAPPVEEYRQQPPFNYNIMPQRLTVPLTIEDERYRQAVPFQAGNGA